MSCAKIDEHLERVTAMAITASRQILALACKFLNDKSAYIFFYDISGQMKRIGKFIHEGTSTDTDDKSFVSIGFSLEGTRLGALTNIKMGNAKVYEWRKEARVIAACSWLDELKKESKSDELAEIRKITIDPNNKEQVLMTGRLHLRFWKNQGGLLKPLPPIAQLDMQNVFTDHVWLDNNWVACGTEKGDIYFIYDSKQCVLQASAFGKIRSPVTCLVAYLQGLIVGSDNGLLAVWNKKDTGRRVLNDDDLANVNTLENNISKL